MPATTPRRFERFLTAASTLGLLAVLLLRSPAWGARTPAPSGPPSPLKGVRVFVDAGHGGIQGTGAIGPQGTLESDANWEVADRLRRLLEQDGAIVGLSRPAKDEQDRMLGEVPRLAVEFNADVFVSVHHNADAALRPWINRSEVFYHVNDDGASADLAWRLNDEFAALHQLPDSRVKSCYAYAVLRWASMPAVLGEACHITNPQAEQKLLLPGAYDAEARAYYRALRGWLEGGLPRVRRVQIEADDGFVRANIDVEAPGGLDPDSVRAEVDGRALETRCDAAAQRIAARLHTPLRAGAHQLTLRFRNTAGNAAQTTRHAFEVPFRFARCDADVSPTRPIERAGGSNRVRIVPRDRHGLPAPAETRVYVAARRGDGETSLVPCEQHGDFWSARIGPEVWRGARLFARVETPRGTVQHPVDWMPAAGGGEGPVWVGALHALHNGKPISGARAWTSDGGDIVAMTEADGWFALPVEGLLGKSLTWRARGYYDKTISVPRVLDALALDENLTPWFGGLLLGETVVIDASGGPDALGRADLRTARALADYVRLAGGEAVLVRDNDDEQGVDTRIAKALAAREALCAILIAHSEPRVHAGEAPDLSVSRGMQRWDDGDQLSLRLAEGCRPLVGTATADQRNWDDWLVMHGHAGFKAVAVSPLLVGAAVTRRLVEQPAFNKLEALGVFYGLLDYQQRKTGPGAWGTLIIETGEAQGFTGVTAVIDDVFVVPAGVDGRCTARYLALGEHRVVVQTPRGLRGPLAVRLEHAGETVIGAR